MNNLQEAIRRLQMNNKLVVLHCCGGSGEGRLLSGLTQGYTALDLSLPNLRLQVEQNARLFIENLALPAYLANLHYAPSLLRGYAGQRGAALGDGCVIGLGEEVRRLEEGLYYVPAEYL